MKLLKMKIEMSKKKNILNGIDGKLDHEKV
jgi:hypothetical protein